MIRTQKFTYRWMNTGEAVAFGLHLGPRATHSVHIGGWTTDVTYRPFEIGIFGHGLQFIKDGFLGTRLNDATLVGRNRTKVQPPKQPRMMVTESLIISCAGMGSVYWGWGRRVKGNP